MRGRFVRLVVRVQSVATVRFVEAPASRTMRTISLSIPTPRVAVGLPVDRDTHHPVDAFAKIGAVVGRRAAPFAGAPPFCI